VFAADLAHRLPSRPPGDVLEIACGTGLVTRRLRQHLDETCRLVATDISKPMIDYARERLAGVQPIEWREADAAKLPFSDGEFGAVVCAFGLMFVPDKKAALREVRRVLKHHGVFLFNVWDRIEENAHAAALAEAIEDLFPGDPEMQYRIPFEMGDPELLRELLMAGGFREVQIEKKRIQVGPVSAHTVATGQIRGTPRSALIEQRGVSLEQAVIKVAAALTKVGGANPYRGSAQAFVVNARAAA
jgi:SAM-dependent methyltransferase